MICCSWGASEALINCLRRSSNVTVASFRVTDTVTVSHGEEPGGTRNRHCHGARGAGAGAGGQAVQNIGTAELKMVVIMKICSALLLVVSACSRAGSKNRALEALDKPGRANYGLS